MLIPYYTHAHANILNKLFIPEIAEPFPIKIHWFRALSFDEKKLPKNKLAAICFRQVCSLLY